MDVSGYQLHRRYAPLLARVEEIAEQAARLVQQRMRERMTPTRIVVAAQKHCPEVMTQAAQRALGVDCRPRYSESAVGYLGITALDSAGTLVVINAGGLISHPQHWLDETVVHELVHAVQFGRPGSRELAMKGLRNNYGIEKLSLPQAWKTNRRIGKDEREAESLEVLARELR
ncbi:hypothetical protein J7E97_08065 [Streptomyces sp. ISL-66]|uniref:hypothetical protein n=1 Tax=Streptomyces sp. ISL-66 TaxID=2819186 RepID=UPI001BEB7766|nr:hypothetical protein [Streptomyces sp. ISL-66]MBT2467828.1 hypothetical protein [Streptomyces sp. ISL-66]